MKRAILPCVLLAGLAATACAWPRPAASQAGAPAAAAKPAPVSRKVQGLTLTSDEAPRVRIEFDRGFKYAGGQSFVLYDVANAEQHFFVDADAQGRVRRLYWVQFEGYLPSNTYKYDYKSKNVVNQGQAARSLFPAGAQTRVSVEKDFSGRERILIAHRPVS
jgi:hypothetical protein